MSHDLFFQKANEAISGVLDCRTVVHMSTIKKTAKEFWEMLRLDSVLAKF